MILHSEQTQAGKRVEQGTPAGGSSSASIVHRGEALAAPPAAIAGSLAIAFSSQDAVLGIRKGLAAPNQTAGDLILPGMVQW